MRSLILFLCLSVFFTMATVQNTRAQQSNSNEQESSLTDDIKSLNQEDKVQSETAKDKAAAPYTFATNEQIYESQRFYKKCMGNESLSSKKDCKCAAMAFLETRMKLGKDATVQEILKENVNTCLIDEKKTKIEDPEKYETDATQAQIDEAQDVYEWCKATHRINIEIDCECLASEFLDKRIEQGPMLARDQILVQITRHTCKNIVQTTGYEYEKCMRGSGFTYGDIRPKDYCECYARAWGKNYDAYNGKVDAASKSSIRMQARTYCASPEAYK